jgi:alginate O-acetyltransferase complex protein AlgI
MLFSSITFIFYFLTSLLLIYYVVPKKFRNYVLLAFSLIFYFLGEPKYIIILVLSCLINYYISKLIDKSKGRKKRLY